MLSKISSYLLDIPIIYNLTQKIFAPGVNKKITLEIKRILNSLPIATKYLDVGCGPKSYLWQVGIEPTGLDISKNYIDEFNKISKTSGIIGSADSIPLDNEAFDSIWSFGLFHHISDNIVKLALNEMLRICQVGGCIIIFDAVLPKSFLFRPLAWLIRKADRGRYMRTEIELLALIPDDYSMISKERITYSYNGLEALVIIIQK